VLKILVIAPPTEFCRTAVERLQKEPGFLVLGYIELSTGTTETNRAGDADLLILDADSASPNGIAVLEELRKMYPKKPQIIVVSENGDDEVVRRANSLGADYYLVKPFPVDLLVRRIWQISELAAAVDGRCALGEDRIVRKAAEYFQRIGMPGHLKGYSYLIEAMVLVVNDHSLASQVTKKLYPQIAERFQTNAVRVERAIRNAIEITWERGDIDQLTQLFSFVDEERGKPTNSAFIASMADIIKLDLARW
jgi:two-component system response regulator (stage 0 sporulation protein A)